MTNPDNAVGTNAAYNGRTSPNALNDCLSAYSTGIMSGWAVAPKTGMTIECGGASGVRDVAIAEDNNGNKLTVDNRSGAPIPVTIEAAPSVNSRIDVVVAYVDNPSTGDGSTTDNPTTCGIIAVKGTAAANPTAPDDAAIRAAITIDGATGGSAYYVIIAEISVGTSVTTIGSGSITQGAAVNDYAEIPDSSITPAKTDLTALAQIAWQNGTYATGFKASTNTSYGGHTIQACIYSGFLCVRFSASRTDNSNFVKGTEYTIGIIPSTIDGVDVSSLIQSTKGNQKRFTIYGSGAGMGWSLLVGTSITISSKTDDMSWIEGEMRFPLNS